MELVGAVILFPELSFAQQRCYGDDFSWYTGKLCFQDYMFVNYPKLANLAGRSIYPFNILPKPGLTAPPDDLLFSRTKVSKLWPGAKSRPYGPLPSR